VGSLIGQGTIDISIQGEEGTSPLLCHWGPALGFWLYGTATILLVTLYLFQYKKKKQAEKLL